MRTPLRTELLQHTVQIVHLVRPVMAALGRKDRDLENQLRRALNSVGLNIAEAYGNTLGNRRLRLETALGSLYEAEAALVLAEAWGFGDAPVARGEMRRLAARLAALSRR